MQKTGGCDSCQDSGAVSQQQISSGSGYLEFPVSETNLVRYIGLNHNSTGASPAEIPFAIKLVNGYAEVRENNQYRWDIPVVTGDVLRIAVQSGVISYAKNGSVFYTSGARATYPLRADTALMSIGATVARVRVSGFTVNSAGSAFGPPALKLTPMRTKLFRFDWNDVGGVTDYRLLENADGTAGYTQVATAPGDAVCHTHQVFLPARASARYILQACNAAGCADSEPVIVSGTLASGIGYVKSSNTDIGDGFGRAVALAADGGTMAVGAWTEDSNATGINGNQGDNSVVNSGAVYVLTRDTAPAGIAGADGWVHQAYVKASNTGKDDEFGSRVVLSADGNTLAVAAPLEDSNATGVNGDQHNDLAWDSGAVYVYARSSAGTWMQQAYIKASNTDTADHFGMDIALSGDGNTLAVGAPHESSNATGINGPQNKLAFRSGAVYVFKRNTGSWTQQAYIKSAHTRESDQFGWRIALSADGRTLAAGSPGEPDSPVSGAVYVFSQDFGNWSQQAHVRASNSETDSEFGSSVALSGDGGTLAAGTGDRVYIFTHDAGNWTQQTFVSGSQPALALSDDGNMLAVGSNLEWGAASGINGDRSDMSVQHAGSANIFTRSAGAWTLLAYVKPSNTQEWARFGYSLALTADGSLLAVGAEGEDSNAVNLNGNQSDRSAPGSGAVYLY